MREKWIWDPTILREISSNVDDGAPLPPALVASMLAAKNVDQAILETRQVTLASYDMALHSAGPTVDPVALWSMTVRKYAAIDYAVDGDRFPGTFGHLFGYDAGYYGYQWALVYAADMFTAFRAAGLENPQVGLRYRKLILEPAGTYDADVEIANFLGRPVNSNAYFKQLGIQP